MPIGAILGAAAPAIGSLIGNASASDDQDKALQAKLAALQAYQGINTPSIDEQKVQLQKLIQQGQLTPEMLQSINLGNSEMQNISTDPRLKDAQMQALSSLAKQGQEGFTAQDRAALMGMQKGNERDVQAKNQQILQEMASRGMGGSGAELASQLINAQGGADRANTNGNQLAAQAQQNALQATAQSGQLGSQMQGQEFNQKSQVAQAQDAINRFNAQNRQNVLQQNVSTSNQAQAANLGEKQRIADSNSGLGNQQELHNKALYQQQYNNQLGKAAGVAGQQGQLSNTYTNLADQQRKMFGTIGQGVGQGIGAISAYKAPSEQPKTDFSKADGFGNFFKGGEVPPDPQPTLGSIIGYPGADDPKKEKPKTMSDGGKVPGSAIVNHDDIRNDTVHALLSPGEIVIPRSVAKSNDDVILDFIKAVKRHSKGK